MTIFLKWLLLPIIVLIGLLLWKGSTLVIKATLLLLPLLGLIGWFAHEGAFYNFPRGNLEDLYASIFIIIFLLCYEAGMLVHYSYLSRKGLSPKEDGIFLSIGLVLLVFTIVYLGITWN